MNIAFFYLKETIVSTVYDHIEAFQKYSSHNIHYFDIANQQIYLTEINKFDAVVVHYTISIFNDDKCPFWLRAILRQTYAKKIIFIQDEYSYVNGVIENLSYLKADLLFTCIPENEVENVYPISKLPDLKKIKTLTGFVPENLLGYQRTPYSNRSIDVGYRARKLSTWYGRLAREKWIIGERFLKDAPKYNLNVDISYEEKNRIYGENWVKFLQESKAVLGCETGASVFDFSGEIQKNVEAYEQEHPGASFEEMEKKFFKGLDGNIKLNEISPRCFECAALGTLMILYEGKYSGVLTPWRHYLPLKKDHSNMEEIVGYLRDAKKWETITQQAYEEVALNPQYSYENFIKNFDSCVSALCKERSVEPDMPKPLPLLWPAPVGLKENPFSFKKKMFHLIFIILKFFPTPLQKALEMKLRVLKRRIMLSLNTAIDLFKNNDLNYSWLFWNKKFCHEYKQIFLIRDYILSIKKTVGISPLSVVSLDQNNIEIYISPDVPAVSVRNSDTLYKTQNIKLVCSDSWGVSKDIRGSKKMLMHKKLLKHVIDV